MTLRVEVRYPAGAVHRVQLPGRVAILGRDPTCDLVLNDPKCSRRHAVLEEDPAGPVIRDTGSANGVIVNGRRVARATLREDDEVKLGDLILKLLPEPTDGTLIVAAEELASLVPAEPVAPNAPTIPRPLSASEIEAQIQGLEPAPGQEAPPAAPPEAPSKPLREQLGGEIVLGPPKEEAAGRRSRLPLVLLFGGAALALLLFALLLVLVAVVLLPRLARPGAQDGQPLWERAADGIRLSFGAEREAAAQLRALAAAQESFRMVCNSGYADLEALLNPSSAFPDYPPDGPAFLQDPTFRDPLRLGYRFHLSVEEAVPPTPSCPFRSYRRYRYSATPVHGGRTLVIGNEGIVRSQDPPRG